MPKLPQVSASDLIRVLSKLQFKIVHQRGSHIKMRHPSGKTVTVPNYKIIKKGTLKKGILNPINLKVEELIRLLKRNK
ncbi:MAG TPA: type II toxin-antitoxin system HicA family toxin [Patescibacteria group bacterium]|nr:type II toxin-antitoxin system HicA family toxin [Patescibacteria group bacterium]